MVAGSQDQKPCT